MRDDLVYGVSRCSSDCTAPPVSMVDTECFVLAYRVELSIELTRPSNRSAGRTAPLGIGTLHFTDCVRA